MRSFAFVAAFVIATASFASADIFAVDLGLGDNPLPATIDLGGGVTVSQFPADDRAEFSIVSDIPAGGALSSDLLVSPSLEKRQVGSSWLTWASGRTPVIYFTQGGLELSLDTPDDTNGIAFWLEPDPFEEIQFTVTAADEFGNETSLTQGVVGDSGAQGFGFYATSGQTIVGVDISGGAGFSVGEFYGSVVPEPASLILLGLGALVLRRR